VKLALRRMPSPSKAGLFSARRRRQAGRALGAAAGGGLGKTGRWPLPPAAGWRAGGPSAHCVARSGEHQEANLGIL